MSEPQRLCFHPGMWEFCPMSDPTLRSPDWDTISQHTEVRPPCQGPGTVSLHPCRGTTHQAVPHTWGLCQLLHGALSCDTKPVECRPAP